jgi:serine/threonine protein kinase
MSTEQVDQGIRDLFTRHGRYIVETVLGKGAMGQVVLARDTKLGRRRVAIKVIRPELLLKKMIRARFMAEAQITAVLECQNIVKVYDVDEFEQSLFITMELLGGGTLTEHMETFGALEPRQAVQITLDLLNALRVAHGYINPDGKARPVIHRDIKPDNLMLSSTGVVKLADFGIAQADIGSTRHTKVGATMGTWGYMSPQQKRDAMTSDARDDIHAVGVLLWMVLSWETGVCEVPGGDSFWRTVNDPGRFDAIPDILKPIIIRATASEREDRYQIVEEMTFALTGVLDSLPALSLDAPKFGTAPMHEPEHRHLTIIPGECGIDDSQMAADSSLSQGSQSSSSAGGLGSAVGASQLPSRIPPPTSAVKSTYDSERIEFGTMVGSEETKDAPKKSSLPSLMILAALFFTTLGVGLWALRYDFGKEDVVETPKTVAVPLQEVQVEEPAVTEIVAVAAPVKTKVKPPSKSKVKATKVEVAAPETSPIEMARVLLRVTEAEGDQIDKGVAVTLEGDGEAIRLTSSKTSAMVPMGTSYKATFVFGGGKTQTLGELPIDSKMVTIQCDWLMYKCRKL